MSKMKYRVQGICFIPAQAVIEIEALSEEQAMKIANERLANAFELRKAYVSGSSDEDHPFDFQASQVEISKS